MLKALVRDVSKHSAILIYVLLILITLQTLQQHWPIFGYDRQAVAHGEWWRLLSGHLVHNNVTHLLLNAVVWLVCSYWFYRYKLVHLFGLIVALSLMISFLITFFSPLLLYYVGFSAVLHGLFIVAGLNDIRRGFYVGYLLCAGVGAKVLWQWLDPVSTADTAVMIGLPVAVDVHGFGLLAGLFISAVLWFWRGRKRA